MAMELGASKRGSMIEQMAEPPPYAPMGWNTTSETFHSCRTSVLLERAELSPPQLIPSLAEQSAFDFMLEDSNCRIDARSRLVEQKTSAPGYRPPESKTRRILWSKERRMAESNGETWTFTKHEVATAFNSLLSESPLPHPGVAQALLSHTSVASLEELWCHLHDAKLEKRLNSRFRRSRSSIVPEISWLDEVTDQDNVQYMRVICQAGVDQEALSRAFGIALSRHSMEAMGVLLNFGAVASACRDAIRQCVKLGDIALVKLLLAAPNAMSIDAWRCCMEPEVDSLQASNEILLLCLAHHPVVACERLLLRALESQNLAATTALLAYGTSDDDFRSIRGQACALVSRVQADGLRYEFLSLFAGSRLLADGPELREELIKDVQSRRLPLVELLVGAGICLDVEPHNAFHWAVAHVDLEILGLLKHGVFSSQMAPALDLVPDATSEAAMLRLLDMFASRGWSGEPVHRQLIRAVRKKHIQLVEMLLRCGASVEYEEALAIHTALGNADFDILHVLLRDECSPDILSTSLPTAMALHPRPIRLRAIQALVNKGVGKRELGVQLQNLVAEVGDVDFELVDFLLLHEAPVDGIGNDVTNAILVATRSGNLPVLIRLCDAAPLKETLSKAVLIAFGIIETRGYETALNAINLLLEKGAFGQPIHEVLIIAAIQDKQLDIVRLLVEQGADANYASGAPFAIALETQRLDLLEILCAGCPPSPGTTEKVLPTAIDPDCYSLPALELLLLSTGSVASALNASWASRKLTDKLRGNPNNISILPCLLRYGLDVNLDQGSVLCFAVQETDVVLLARVLLAKPNIKSLKTAFRAATGIRPRHVELDMMKLLLEKANLAEIGQTEALLQQTIAALLDDHAGMLLVLKHGADVDFDNGRAVQYAAAAGNMEVLSRLLLSKPSISTIKESCLSAAQASSSIHENRREWIFQLLIPSDHTISVKDKSMILASSVKRLPRSSQLPKYLLSHGAQIDEFETLEVALKTASQDLFVALADSIKDPGTVERMFRHIPNGDVSEALLDSLGGCDLGDLSLVKLLLRHGASVGYKGCASFSLALGTNSLEAVRLLSRYLPDDRMAGIAFDHVRKATCRNSEVRVGAYDCLLQWNIGASSTYKALRDSIKNGSSDLATVKLLLEKGTDPNNESAYCFVLASRADLELEFRALSKYAELSKVFRALLNHYHEEWKIARWFRMCLEEAPRSAKIKQEELLFDCIRKFPRGSSLVQLLLDNGGPASAQVSFCLCPGWRPEVCTLLIWALFSRPRVENDVILTLVARGGHQCLPSYLTPATRVSAALGCLLDKTRTPVLKALIDLDGERVLDSTVSGSVLSRLGAYPQELDQESSLSDMASLPLKMASLYLGNFDAFRVLTPGELPDDGMMLLCTAALLALPRFVHWLLETHDPNERAEGEFDNLIPLAIACQAKPQPWCRVANEEERWDSRKRRTVQMLARRTDPRWRHRGRTVLHFALEQGPEMTSVMVEALDVRDDPERDERYLYMDKEGIEYSPDEYVDKMLRREGTEAVALKNCLARAGMASRYFRRVGPEGGVQPPGFHGLPPAYAALWGPRLE
ncbi:hypothetical protein GGR56DRAFT_609444 [Xylariaceae sp. FL0804]|nr:hypothetical protein GGR56DRAFT_609444 [Xylariaceae sp. FL0804]